MVAPEALLLEASGHDEYFRSLIESAGPLLAPYDMLVDEDGWLVDPGHSELTAPFDDPARSVDQRAVNALLVACDYAVRRGATDHASARIVLERESPIAVVSIKATASIHRTAARFGISAESPADKPASFARRARAHAELPFPSDPVLSFQPRPLDWDMGDNSLSSFVVHNEGNQDGLTIIGELSERWGVEVGLPKSMSFEALAEIELDVAEMPSFLRGVTSRFAGQALEVGWVAGQAPEVEQIGNSMRVWSKALFDLEFADVRIFFAPPRGRAPVLTDMRARARAFRLYRDAVMAGHSDPGSVVLATPD